MTLSPSHFKHLRASGLLPSTIEEIMKCFSVLPAEIDRLSPALKPCESLLAFPYPGVDGFCRYRLFPPRDSMKYWQPSGSGVHLYILPSVRAILTNPDIEIAITEGEKKAACLTQNGVPTIGVGGVWSWGDGTGDLHPEFNCVSFIDRPVLIIYDSNAWRKEKEEIGHALYALGKAVESRGGKVDAVIVPPTQDGKDQGADDYIVAHGIDNFKKLKRIKLRHDGLAQFKPWWEQWRKKKAGEEKEIARLAVRLQPVEPWPDPVDGTVLLNDIRDSIKRFIVASPEAIIAETLWIIFTHTLDAFSISPLLVFSSPVRQCGKSINQAVVSKFCPKSLVTSNISPAALFRVVDKFLPTLIVDECDSTFETNPEIRELVNASHLRSQAYVLRVVGDNHEPESFSTWAPKCLALIGNLPDTTASRSIVVKMQRKPRNKRTERFSALKDYPELQALQRKAARWANDNLPTLRQAEPENLPDIGDRDIDNWIPLIAIADVAGGEWPKLAREAAVRLCGEPITEPKGVELLQDIKVIFDGDPESDSDGGCERISSEDLVNDLNNKEGSPWADYNHGKGITKNQVARMLKGFEIPSPKQLRFGDKTLKGYLSEWFNNAFERYLPQPSIPTAFETKHPKQVNENEDLGSIFETKQDPNVSDRKMDLSTEKQSNVSDVSIENGQREALDIFSTETAPGSIRYRDGNGKLHYAGSVNEAWDKIIAEHESRKEKL